MAKEITYEVIESIDVIHNSDNSDFTIEVNKISWNKKPPMIDIRRWDRSDNPKFPVGKGISISDEACERLVDALLEKGYGSDTALKKAVKDRGLVKTKKKEQKTV